MKKILIINGHPNKDSFCNSIAEAYKKGAIASGNEVEILNIRELKFDINLELGYTSVVKLEADLILAQEKITWANHIVIIHPVWWGSVPALLKGFIDKVFTPGFAFKYRKNSPLWDKLLKGKSGDLIYTCDTPIWLYKYFFRAPSVNQIKKRTMQFSGISPVRVIGIAPIRNSTEEFRVNWLKKIEKMASK